MISWWSLVYLELACGGGPIGPQMQNTPSILLHDSDFCTAAWREVFVIIWRHNTTMAGVDACREGIGALGEAHPKGVAQLTIVEPGAPMPSAATRDALAAVLRDFATTIKVSGVCFEGAGFRAAAVRSVVTGINLVAKQPFPHKVFATVNAAASWLGPSLPEGPAPSREIVEAVADLRTRLGAVSPRAVSASP